MQRGKEALLRAPWPRQPESPRGRECDAVREVVEGAVGPWASNEYYEMQVDGLTPQLSK